MWKRFTQCLISLLVALDIAIQCIVKAPFWIFFKRARPSSRETISATVGQAAAKGYKWGIWLADLIDGVFGKGHCAAAYAKVSSYNGAFDL